MFFKSLFFKSFTQIDNTIVTIQYSFVLIFFFNVNMYYVSIITYHKKQIVI